jgi:LPS-assembly protein
MRYRQARHERPQIIPAAGYLWFVFCLLVSCGLVAAPPAAGQADRAQAGIPWEISADRIEYDQTNDEYMAEGNVTIAREKSTLTADRVRLNQTQRLAWAEGQVRLLSGRDVLTGSRLRLHLDHETGVLSDGSLFFADSHFYLTGSQILKTGPDTYDVKDATATTCDGPNPDWRITSRDVRINVEGYGSARHAALWARQVPLIYTPYLVFPVKLRRQTGLLTPEFSYSDRKGIRYLQPLFWAISDSTDATFFIDHMSERGTRLGAEYRYMASETAKGTFMLDGFEDRRVDDGQADHSQRWGYQDDRRLRPNEDRYWFRAKVDQDLPWELTARLDLDVVSDQDYLKEFQTGHGGFNQSRDYFRNTFRRDLDDFNDPVRLNQLNLNRLWTGYTFNTDVRWYDDVVKRRQRDTDDTLQQLPQVMFDGTKKRIADSPFYFDLLSSYTHFYRQDGTRGHRTDLYPRAYYPTRLFNAFFIEPSAGIRQTAWHIDSWGNAQSNGGDGHYRAIYDLKLDTSTDFFNIFNVDMAGYDRVKHNIRPQIVYEYIPDQDQEDLPRFDDWDRIEARNLITYSVTNTLIARAVRKSGARSRPAFTYAPFLRFKLENSFDINKHNQDHPQPFSNVLAELHVRPGRYGLVQADALWSPYDSQFYAYNAGIWLNNLRGDRFRIDYRFTREAEALANNATLPGVHSIDIAAAWLVTPRWQLRGKYERNIETGNRIESGVGISYISQCWRVDLNYREEPGDQTIAVMVHLVGLGAFGQ